LSACAETKRVEAFAGNIGETVRSAFERIFDRSDKEKAVKKIHMVLPATLLALASVQVFAQTDGASTTSRAEVKAETRQAVKAGAIPKGQSGSEKADTGGPSTTPRAEVKADTKAAVKAGAIPKGQAAPEGAQATGPSTVPRADVKADTKAAVKAGAIPRGEADVTTK
jgi:hypothetical protein